MQVIGVASAAFVMAPIMTVLHEGSLKLNENTGGIGGEDLPAPQAVLFSKLAQGFFGDGQIPWTMVMIGIGIGAAIVIVDAVLNSSEVGVRLHVMPVAVGIYLPLSLSVPILIGGVIHHLLSRRATTVSTRRLERSTLVASGVIAGESLMGVCAGAAAYFGYQSLEIGQRLPVTTRHLTALSVCAFLAFCLWMYLVSRKIDSADEDSSAGIDE